VSFVKQLLFLLFLTEIIFSCQSARDGYTNSAIRIRQNELNAERKKQLKYKEMRYKQHRKNQSPAVRKKMKKELRAMRKEIRRLKRKR
jgi:hypothetical protein